MSLAFLLILLPTICYAGTAGYYAYVRDWPQAVIFLGYSVANTGFLAIEWMRARLT